MPKLLLLLLSGLLSALLLQPAAGLADISTVTVRGAAELKVPADQARFEAVILSDGVNPEQALADNASRSEKVLMALMRAGLDENEITSGHFVVDPVWSQMPRKTPENWKPTIIGYSIANYLRIKTVKINRIGEFIAAAVKGGSNEINGLHFDLANPRQYRQEAIRVASEKANEDARALAEAAGTRLGKVVSLNLDHARATPHRVMANRAFMAEADSAPAVRPGEITVQASVTAVYELED